MIDLFSVKLNGQYDEIGAEPTITDGLFLCDTTGDNYTRGYSYQITDGNATKTDIASDYKVQKVIYPAVQNTCEWLNNWFTIRRKSGYYSDDTEYYSSNGAYHELAQTPASGDLCKIRTTNNWNYLSLYSFYFVSYVTVEDDVITGDNDLFNSDETYYYYIMHLPQDVEKAISAMIYYDVYTRGTVDDVKSESIGNYSYSKEDVYIGSLAYPKALVSGLEACYKKVRFVQ